MRNEILQSYLTEDEWPSVAETGQEPLLLKDEVTGRDPGVLVIDDFLTEEEEAKILEALGSEFSARVLRFVQMVARWTRLMPATAAFQI
jgi:hypothetical protein